MVRLRDGSEVEDPRLGRLKQWDARSRNFPIRTLLPDKPLRSYTWSCGTVLDQGNVGACVGFSWAHELAARPKIHPADNRLGMTLYHSAQELDEWPGSNYEGSSVLGGAKAVQRAGYLREYRWAFGIQDALGAIAFRGPVVLGINWYSRMFDVVDGFVRVGGSIAGGHAILARGVNVRTESVLLHNSWSPSWGVHGTARISFSDLERLLREDGECCVPTQRL